MKSKAVLNPKKISKENKKVAMVQLKPENKKIKKRRRESYSTHIYKILKQVHPQVGISSKAMMIMNSFVLDMIERVATEAGNLVKKANSKTLKGRDIQSATKLLMPGELGNHAVSEGLKSLQLYIQSKNRSP